MLLLASALPAINRTVSLVLPPLAMLPVIGTVSSLIDVINGVLGAAASTLREIVLLFAVLPAASVTEARN